MLGSIVAADRIIRGEVAVVFGVEASAAGLRCAGWLTRRRDCWGACGVAGPPPCQAAVAGPSTPFVVAGRACECISLSKS